MKKWPALLLERNAFKRKKLHSGNLMSPVVRGGFRVHKLQKEKRRIMRETKGKG